MTLVLLVLLGAPTVARAENVAAAQAAYRKGTNHYDLSEYKEALASFKEAYRQHEDPVLLFNIAQCHRQLGDKAAAVRFYRTYLIKVPTAPKRGQIVEMIERLEADLAAAPVAPPPTATGAKAPAADPVPAPATVTPAPATAPAPAPVVTTLPATTPNGTAAVAAPAPSPAPSSRTPLHKKWWVWTIVGVAAVGIGVGVGLGVTLSGASTTPTATTDFGTFRF